MGFLENIIGTNPQYTVIDNKTGEKIIVRNPKELEKYAAQEQDRNPDKPKPFFDRLFSK
ncbi:hypothetical protein IK146_03715 [Candidatus Saccharibacteria bacterium]|nr:hypothetical protein [Candidatus Saccharibacteria bacterium]